MCKGGRVLSDAEYLIEQYFLKRQNGGVDTVVRNIYKVDRYSKPFARIKLDCAKELLKKVHVGKLLTKYTPQREISSRNGRTYRRRSAGNSYKI